MKTFLVGCIVVAGLAGCSSSGTSSTTTSSRSGGTSTTNSAAIGTLLQSTWVLDRIVDPSGVHHAVDVRPELRLTRGTVAFDGACNNPSGRITALRVGSVTIAMGARTTMGCVPYDSPGDVTAGSAERAFDAVFDHGAATWSIDSAGALHVQSPDEAVELLFHAR